MLGKGQQGEVAHVRDWGALELMGPESLIN